MAREPSAIAKKKKPKPFRAATAVKALARETIGTPPPVRRDPETKRKVEKKAAKHKPTLGKLLTEE
jgi:hypothetical protein